MVKNLLANGGDAGDVGSIPRLGRSPAEENGNPLLYSCLGNPMSRGAWQLTVHRITESQRRLRTYAESEIAPWVTWAHLGHKDD